MIRVPTGGARPVLSRPRSFVRFCGGVPILALLILTVIVGPVASNRIIHVAQRRTGSHSLHHAWGIVAVLCLALQVATELVADPVGILGALAPLTSVSVVVVVGGVVTHLVLTVMSTRVVWACLAQNGRRRRRWPPPSTGHLSWLSAVAHELNPRPPPTFRITASYSHDGEEAGPTRRERCTTRCSQTPQAASGTVSRAAAAPSRTAAALSWTAAALSRVAAALSWMTAKPRHWSVSIRAGRCGDERPFAPHGCAGVAGTRAVEVITAHLVRHPRGGEGSPHRVHVDRSRGDRHGLCADPLPELICRRAFAPHLAWPER